MARGPGLDNAEPQTVQVLTCGPGSRLGAAGRSAIYCLQRIRGRTDGTLNALLWAYADVDFPWAIFPAVGWGIGLTFHYLYGYRRVATPIRDRQRKIEEYGERVKEPV